jgi:UDP-N-acetylmuramate--L-alanine ligase
MIGIGGTSMSGIATILKKWGFYVTGSDANQSELVDKLIENNIPVIIGHDLENIKRANLVVYSAAIPEDDVEMLEAKRLGIQTMERSTFLGLITKAYKNTICVSGTHGKTTTTSMLSVCFLEAKKDPTIQVGAILKQIGGNYRVGNSDCFILESCEYVESFLKFHPRTEVILNIDNDHLDYFKDLDHIKNAFVKFVKLLPEEGLLVVNADDENCASLYKNTTAKIVTFGINNEKCNFVARNISYDNNGFPLFDVYRNNTFYKSIKLSVPGLHNVYNALACIATCHEYGIEKETIKTALAKYTGAHRRFELVGETNGAYVYDDYGHHPTEIKAVYDAMKKKKYNRSWVVFQPHTYSRTKNLLADFAQVLSGFDNIIITDIYAAREKNTLGISSTDLVNQININRIGKKAIYMSDFNEIAKYIRDRVMPNDIVLTIGAGTVTNIGPMIVNS